MSHEHDGTPLFGLVVPGHHAHHALGGGGARQQGLAHADAVEQGRAIDDLAAQLVELLAGHEVARLHSHVVHAGGGHTHECLPHVGDVLAAPAQHAAYDRARVGLAEQGVRLGL